MNKPSLGWMFLSILTGSAILPALCYPSLNENSQLEPHIVLPEARKFAEKPNATKKVPPAEDRNELDDVQTNQILDNSNGFSWGQLLNTVISLLFNPAAPGPSKSDAIDNDQHNGISQSPWTNILAVGIKILTTFLGGGQGVGDGIDKVDNNNSGPMTFIHIVFTLLDALKTSFSQRSMHARSLGKKDSISDAATAGITFVKGYLRTMKSQNDSCVHKIICEANKECADDQPNGIYCQLGTYAASTILQKPSSMPYESLQEAGRRGRSARSNDECKQVYVCSDN